jgi:hypothetical protein
VCACDHSVMCDAVSSRRVAVRLHGVLVSGLHLCGDYCVVTVMLSAALCANLFGGVLRWGKSAMLQSQVPVICYMLPLQTLHVAV